jgi:predicted Holliday junction resolvase-like endonuclease
MGAFLAFLAAMITLYIHHKSTKKEASSSSADTVPMSHFKETTHFMREELNQLRIAEAALSNELTSLKSKQQSKSVRLGLISENVLPFHKEFPFNYKDLVPMFRPIDYLVFEEDKITFLEIKMGTSQLSEKQKNIRRLVREGKVEWQEHRVDEDGYTIKS